MDQSLAVQLDRLTAVESQELYASTQVFLQIAQLLPLAFSS